MKFPSRFFRWKTSLRGLITVKYRETESCGWGLNLPGFRQLKGSLLQSEQSRAHEAPPWLPASTSSTLLFPQQLKHFWNLHSKGRVPRAHWLQPYPCGVRAPEKHQDKAGGYYIEVFLIPEISKLKWSRAYLPVCPRCLKVKPAWQYSGKCQSPDENRAGR